MYYVKESEESKQKRINDFGKWLEGEGEGDEEEKESGAAADKTVAPAGVVLTGLSPEGKAVSAAANQLLATASDEMLAPFIKVRNLLPSAIFCQSFTHAVADRLGP